MIYVTHDQIEAMTMADKIVVLRDGTRRAGRHAARLYNQPANRFVAGFIGSPKMNFFEGTLLDAQDGHATVDIPGLRFDAAPALHRRPRSAATGLRSACGPSICWSAAAATWR